ncbi:hypothetical protein MRX96_039240 [Rhipicephalus microplus]
MNFSFHAGHLLLFLIVFLEFEVYKIGENVVIDFSMLEAEGQRKRQTADASRVIERNNSRLTASSPRTNNGSRSCARQEEHHRQLSTARQGWKKKGADSGSSLPASCGRAQAEPGHLRLSGRSSSHGGHAAHARCCSALPGQTHKKPVHLPAGLARKGTVFSLRS